MGRATYDRQTVREAVLAACKRLLANGENPTLFRLAAILPYGECLMRSVRLELSAEGLLVLPMACVMRVKGETTIDDPFEEPPDDPDAAAIQARIAAIRSTKRDAPEPRIGSVMTTRCTLPYSRPRSRQAARA